METVMRRCVLSVLAAGAAWSGCAAAEQQPAGRRPNILFIMSDDHAAHAVSAYSDKLIQTPHIDRLAQEGCLFTRAFAVNSICTPSRATILTGQYSHRNGVPVFNRLAPETVTVAHRLRQAGYHTAMIGKWHLGSDPQGFDHWEILPGQGEYFDPVLYTREGSKRYAGKHCTDVITELAVEQLRARPKDRPFFMMMHHKAPHRPWEPAPRHRELWRQRTIPEPDTLFDDTATRGDALRMQKQSIARDLTKKDVKEDVPEGLAGRARTRWLYQRYMQDYLGCIQGIDESVGKVLDALDAEGIADNTVVIYTSDQGFFLGDHGLYDKRFMYEESIRMPFLVRWPKGIKAGTRQEALAINCDFAPTFLALAGEGTPPEMQGESLLPLLGGGQPDTWRKSFYYRYYHDPGDHNTPRHYGVRTETHKLVYFDKLDQWECYDLAKDPQELNNLYAAGAEQATVAALKAELARLRKALGDDDRYADPKTWPAQSSYVKPPPERLRSP